MNILMLLQLLFAHLLADFVLQTDSMCENKRHAGIKGLKNQLFHSLIHGVCSYVFVAQWTNLMLPFFIFLTHFAVDYFKEKLMETKIAEKMSKKKAKVVVFILDQFVHLLVIVILWWIFFLDGSFLLQLSEIWNTPKLWLIATAYILVLHPCSILLGMFISRWESEIKEQSLPQAGKWIGYLERFLVLTFVLIGHIELVCYLLMAKSVFRFGNLSTAKDIKTTEYVLIGTLASFSIAMIVGQVVKMLI